MDGLAPHKIVCHREPWTGLIKVLYGRIDHSSGRIYGAEPVVLKEVTPGIPVQPMVQLEYEEGQSLMDALWECGIRPSEGTGSAGAMAAVQKHLEDMRTLVFKPAPKP